MSLFNMYGWMYKWIGGKPFPLDVTTTVLYLNKFCLEKEDKH